MVQTRMRAWVRAPDGEHRDTAVAVLAGAGLDVGTDAADGGPGVLIGPAALCSADAVADCSCNGAHRLVVIVVGEPVAEPWALLTAGASDVLQWVGDGVATLQTVAARIQRWHLVDRLAGSAPVVTRLVGSSRTWTSVLRWLVEIARFSDASVLVCGESGTGKELVARLVHALDPERCHGPFVVVDCASIVATLSAPELFGHERGAFTGAHTARQGAFGQADRGVLFLDEIGELPAALQPELLRVLQERTFKPLGSSQWHKTDFRLVCATNRDLAELERAGRFRRDLRARLSAVTVALPPLAERIEDIPLLVRHFLTQLLDGQAPELDPAVEAYLMTRRYPGNVRELRQLVAQLSVRYVGTGRLTIGMIPEGERPQQQDRPDRDGYLAGLRTSVADALACGADLRTLKSMVASLAVEIALAEAGGNVTGAARQLGVTTRALQLRRSGGEPETNGAGALAETTP